MSFILIGDAAKRAGHSTTWLRDRDAELAAAGILVLAGERRNRLYVVELLDAWLATQTAATTNP